MGAMAGGLAAASADGGETGGEERAVGAALFDAAVELAADQGGVLGQTHQKAPGCGEGLRSKHLYQKKGEKGGCEKKAE